MSEMILGNDDLIRRKDAIKALEKWKEAEARTIKDYGEVFVLGRTSAFADAIAAMVFVPSAHQEIIRCKDCKHYVLHVLFGRSQGWCERLCDEFDKSLARGTEDDDFCSRAERRSDG